MCWAWTWEDVSIGFETVKHNINARQQKNKVNSQKNKHCEVLVSYLDKKLDNFI